MTGSEIEIVLRMRDQYSHQMSAFHRAMNALLHPIRAVSGSMGKLAVGAAILGVGYLALRKFGTGLNIASVASNITRAGVVNLGRSLLGLVNVGTIVKSLGISAMIGGILGAMSLGAAVAFTTSIMDMAISFNSLREQSAIAFKVAGMSSDEASEHFQNLALIADKSKFSIMDIAKHAASLDVVGYKAKEVEEIMSTMAGALGAIPSSTADSMYFMVGFFRRVKEAGMVGLGEIESLGAAGVPALQILAKEFGITGDMAGYAMRKMLMKGLPTSLVLPKLKEGMRKWAKDSANDQNKTWEGAWRTISDKISRYVGTIMAPAFEALRMGLVGLIHVMDTLEQAFLILPGPLRAVVKWLGMVAVILLPVFILGLMIYQTYSMFFTIIKLISGYMGIKNFLGMLYKLFSNIAAVIPFQRLLRFVGGLGFLTRIFSGFRIVAGPIIAILGLFGGWFLVILVVLALLYFAWTNNWFGIRDILTKVWNDYLVPILVGLWALLVMLAGWAGAAWDFSVKFIGDAWARLWWLIDMAVTGFVAAWNFAAQFIGDAWTRLWWLIDMAVTGFTMAWNFAGYLLGEAWTWIVWLAGQIAAAAQVVWATTVTILGAAWAWVVWLAGQIAKAAAVVWATTVTILGDAWAWVVWLAGEIAQASSVVWATTVTVLGDAWQWVIWLAGQIEAAAQITWNTFTALLGDAWQWVIWLAGQIVAAADITWNTFTALLGDAWQWVLWLASQIDAAATITWNTFTALLGDAWQWVLWLASQIDNAAQVTWNTLVNLVGDAWKYIQWIYDIVKGGVQFTFQLLVNLIGAGWDLLKWMFGGGGTVTPTAPAMPSGSGPGSAPPAAGGGGGGGGHQMPAGLSRTDRWGRTAAQLGIPDPDNEGYDGQGWVHFASGGYAGSATKAIIGDRPGGEYVLGGDQIASMLGGGAGGGGSTYAFNNYGTVLGEEDWFVKMNDMARRRGRLP